MVRTMGRVYTTSIFDIRFIVSHFGFLEKQQTNWASKNIVELMGFWTMFSSLLRDGWLFPLVLTIFCLTGKWSVIWCIVFLLAWPAVENQVLLDFLMYATETTDWILRHIFIAGGKQIFGWGCRVFLNRPFSEEDYLHVSIIERSVAPEASEQTASFISLSVKWLGTLAEELCKLKFFRPAF